MNTELLFNLANFAYLTGTLFLTRRVVKNRGALKDFDPYGSFINVIGLSINGVALFVLGFYTTVVISIPTILFWIIASIYSFKYLKIGKDKEKNKDDI
jgi:hypothetical protein